MRFKVRVRDRIGFTVWDRVRVWIVWYMDAQTAARFVCLNRLCSVQYPHLVRM